MADTAQPTAVALDDATVAFRVAGDRVYTAVERASLSVAHGEFVAIVGPTGCGKSTLLNVAAGLLKPAAGSVKIFDQPLTGLNRDAGYLFQADALFPWKTAIDNVAIGLEIKGAPREQVLQRAQGWLTSVGLGAFGNRAAFQVHHAVFRHHIHHVAAWRGYDVALGQRQLDTAARLAFLVESRGQTDERLATP